MIRDFAPYLGEQIHILQQAIRSFKWSMVVLILVGLGIVIVSLVMDSAKGFAPDLIKLGGGVFMVALATLPYKEIAPRHERIKCYGFLKAKFEVVETLSKEEQQDLTKLANEILRENAKR